MEGVGEVNIERTQGSLLHCISASPFTSHPPKTHTPTYTHTHIHAGVHMHVHRVEMFSGKQELAKLPDSASPEIKDKWTPNKLEKKGKFNIKNNF